MKFNVSADRKKSKFANTSLHNLHLCIISVQEITHHRQISSLIVVYIQTELTIFRVNLGTKERYLFRDPKWSLFRVQIGDLF